MRMIHNPWNQLSLSLSLSFSFSLSSPPWSLFIYAIRDRRERRRVSSTAGRPPFNFYHVITVIITSAGNGSYANKGRGAFLSIADAQIRAYVCMRVRV